MEFALFFYTHKCVCRSIRFRPRRSANTMYVIFTVVRHVVVDHQVDIINVDTTAKNICCHQDGKPATLEFHQHFLPIGLFQIAVNLICQ